MGPIPQNLRDPELASGYAVSKYTADVNAQNQDSIADAVHRRFQERYLDAILPSQTHGFTKVAVACLMIEALQSFRLGWLTTTKKGDGAKAFTSFFQKNPEFVDFVGHEADFYKGVRCGILHQAESTKGWRIRVDPLQIFEDKQGVRTINANMFLDALQRALNRYRDDLVAANWNDQLWKNLRHKMTGVCKNCAP